METTYLKGSVILKCDVKEVRAIELAQDLTADTKVETVESYVSWDYYRKHFGDTHNGRAIIVEMGTSEKRYFAIQYKDISFLRSIEYKTLDLLRNELSLEYNQKIIEAYTFELIDLQTRKKDEIYLKYYID